MKSQKFRQKALARATEGYLRNAKERQNANEQFGMLATIQPESSHGRGVGKRTIRAASEYRYEGDQTYTHGEVNGNRMIVRTDAMPGTPGVHSDDAVVAE